MEQVAIPLADQIAELKRELAIRKNTYPKWVDAGRMRPAAAEIQIARMTAALHTLMDLDSASGAARRPDPVTAASNGENDASQ